MADPRSIDLEELVLRPGTYFNPQTEVLLVVDDSPEMDQEIFAAADPEGADWVIVSDEVPVDEHARDELIEAFQVRYHPGADRSLAGADDEVEDDENDDPEADELDDE